MAGAAPSAEQLSQVAERLAAGRNPDPAAQLGLVQWLQQYRADPSFAMCLALVGVAQGSVPDDIRQIAIIQLKASVSHHWKSVSPGLTDVRERLLGLLGDPFPGARLAASGCICAIPRAGGVEAWPGLVEQLWAALERAADPAHRACVLACVRDVCEDVGAALPAEVVAALVAALAAKAAAIEPAGIAPVVESLFYLVEPGAEAMSSPEWTPCCCGTPAAVLAARGQLPQILAGLRRAVQAAPSAPGAAQLIRRNALWCYRLLLVAFFAELGQAGALGEILPLVFDAATDRDDGVALAACHFWSDFAAKDAAVAQLIAAPGLLPQLLQMLLQRMHYSEIDIGIIEDEQTRDDLRPAVIHRGRKQKKQDGDDEDDDGVQDWTPRRAAALALDRLASKLKEQLVSPPGAGDGWLLGQLQGKLTSTVWQDQEAGLLALGAISGGCTPCLTPHLDTLVTSLLQMAGDAQRHFLVRSMACWTLSRYSDHIVEHQDTARFLDPYLDLLLRGLGDQSRKVQETACGAFSVLVDGALVTLTAPRYLSTIVQRIGACLQPGANTTRNLVMLLEAVATLTYVARDSLATLEAKQLIYDPIFQRLLPQTPDDSPLLPHVMMCIRRCVEGLGRNVSGYAPLVLQRGSTLLGKYFAGLAAYEAKQTPDPPDPELACFAFNLFGCMAAEMPQEMEGLLGSTQVPGTECSVLQLAFVALKGDAKRSHAHKHGHGHGHSHGGHAHGHSHGKKEESCGSCTSRVVGCSACRFLSSCAKNLSKGAAGTVAGNAGSVLAVCDTDDVCTAEACWLLGELFSVLGADSAQIAAPIASTMVPMLSTKKDWAGPLLANCALCVGRIGVVAPQLLSQHLPACSAPLFGNLSNCRDSPAKQQATVGALQALQGAPAVLGTADAGQAVVACLGSFRHPSAEFLQQVRQLLVQLGAPAQALAPHLPPHFR